MVQNPRQEIEFDFTCVVECVGTFSKRCNVIYSCRLAPAEWILYTHGSDISYPELGSVIGGGDAEASTAILSREGLFALRELLVPFGCLAD